MPVRQYIINVSHFADLRPPIQKIYAGQSNAWNYTGLVAGFNYYFMIWAQTGMLYRALIFLKRYFSLVCIFI